MGRVSKLGGMTRMMGVVLAVAAGCSDTNSATELKPEGPPEVLQVFVRERTVSESGAVRIASQLAFGDHPDIDESDNRTVTGAVADSSQIIRVVFDELLLGNNLEQVVCNDGSLATVPVGADPDDLARCAGEPDELAANCNGEFAVCEQINPITGGPTGILDDDDDRAPDQLRFRDDIVTLDCDGTVMPLNIAQTFYQPSGNQQIPAAQGINGLGPAIVIKPSLGLRSGAACTIVFSDEVVDKDFERVCASSGGVCTPGDTSAISWRVEPMRVTATNPPNNATDVNPDLAARILFLFNAVLDATDPVTGLETLGRFTVTVDGVPVDPAQISLEWAVETPQQVIVVLADGYVPNASYSITVEGTQDQFGGPLPEPFTLNFTTGMGAPVPDAAVPDAAVPDAAAPDAALPDADPADAAIDAM